MPIRVTITDDHIMVVNGLQNSLRTCDHIEVIGTYSTGRELLQSLKMERPDIILLDIQLPDKNGDELSRIITEQYPDIRIIILTALESPFHLQEMMEIGCKGYLLKTSTDQQTLVKAIEQVYEGEEFVEPRIKEQLYRSMLHTKKNDPVPNLTAREKEILQLTADGFTSQEIADKLFLSRRTVENHRANIFQKFDVKNTTLLLRKAIELKLVEGGLNT